MGVGHRLAVRKNDLIEVIAGKDRGKRGRVVRIIPKTQRVLVERINIVKRHTRPGRISQQGGILEREAPISIANVMLVCPKCDRPTRYGKAILADGKKVRVCKKCGEVID